MDELNLYSSMLSRGLFIHLIHWRLVTGNWLLITSNHPL